MPENDAHVNELAEFVADVVTNIVHRTKGPREAEAVMAAIVMGLKRAILLSILMQVSNEVEVAQAEAEATATVN